MAICSLAGSLTHGYVKTVSGLFVYADFRFATTFLRWSGVIGYSDPITGVGNIDLGTHGPN